MNSVPSEECVISSRSHRAPSEHTGQAVNSTVRLTWSETTVTNGPTRATVHPYRSSSCHNNLQQQVAPRRQGRVPSLSRNGIWGGPSPWCNTHAGKRVRFCGSWVSFSSGCQPGVRVVPFRQMPGSGVAGLWYDPPLSGGRRPLTHSPRREVVSGPATQRVPTPRLLGDSKEWR